MAQILKALRGVVLNRASSLLKNTKRLLTGEAVAEKKILKLIEGDLYKSKILDVDKKKWVPNFVKEKQKNKIRLARELRSAASKGELEWMLANPDKATKVYRSGTREFGGEANRLALLQARLEALKPFIEKEAEKIYNNRLKLAKKTGKIGKVLGTASLIAGIPTYLITLYNTGPSATLLDLLGSATRKDDHTPRFTHTYTYDDFNDALKAFLLDVMDKKQTKYWSNPEERDAYFEKHPNDTIRTGWIGRIGGTNIKQSDYKKYYGADYGGLSDMPKLTGFGLDIGMKDPVEAGMYEIMQTLGSFPIAYTKDHAIIDDTWDFSKADRDKKYPENPTSNILQFLRTFAGKHGTNEADNYIPIVKTHAEVPYKVRNKTDR